MGFARPARQRWVKKASSELSMDIVTSLSESLRKEDYLG